MQETLTKYSSFEAMKADVRPSTITEAEKEQLRVEAKQLAEVLQALRKQQQMKIALKAAVDSLSEDYKTNQELIAFTQLDGESFHLSHQ